MSERVSIEAKSRTGSPQHVRAEGGIPGVLYGHGVENQSFRVDEREFTKVFQTVGQTTLFEVQLDSEPHQVLIREVQHHPLTDRILHIDLYQVRLDEKVKADVPLEFTGTAAAVKDLGGVLVRNADTIEVEALPQDLPSAIPVDIGLLTDFDAAIHVRDLAVPEAVEVLRDGDDVVALVQAPRTAEELEKLDEEVAEDVESVEGVEEKTEGEEGEAGDETKDEAVEEGEKSEESDG